MLLLLAWRMDRVGMICEEGVSLVNERNEGRKSDKVFQ